MDIEYAKYSKFLEPCKIAIQNNFQALENGIPIEVSFIKGGYNGEIDINIEANKNTFSTSWNNQDPTRFPARIKAAATALKYSQCLGVYKITHNNGLLIIMRVV